VPAHKRKLLLIDSYHEGYPWSDGIVQGALKTLDVRRGADGRLDDSRSSVTVQIARMDTKRNTAEDYQKEAGKKVKAIIDSWKPDIVIAADDNASKLVIVPYFRDTELPVVFCGVNWDASVYGFPARNVTGMVEVSLLPSMLEVLKPLAHGPRIGLLGADNESNLKEVDAYRARFKLDLAEVRLVSDFEAWKAAFVALQGTVDLLLLAPPSFLGAGGADAAKQPEARRFVLESTRIPTGSVEDWIAPYSLVTFAKRASEQGEWAAATALEVLAGTPPSQIPIATNQQASVYLNMPLAKRLGVRFPVELVEQATLVEDR
jgi:ABC-type uncharacterized transport system substrate-binding protein